MSPPLCVACEAEYLHGPAVIVHEDDCPRLQALRAAEDSKCSGPTTGFCDCPAHGVSA